MTKIWRDALVGYIVITLTLMILFPVIVFFVNSFEVILAVALIALFVAANLGGKNHGK